MKNRFLIGSIILSAVLSVSRLGVQALQITAPTFVAPIFKTVFFKAGGDDSQPAGVQLDDGGIYISDAAIQGQSNVLRLGNGGTFVKDFVSNSSFDTGSISSVNIINGSITSNNLTNVTITNTNIQNNSLTIANFDPSIVWPTGQHYYTNSICSPGTAITSVSNGNVTCAVLTGFSVASIPNCGTGGTIVFSGGVWDCQVVLLSSTITDAYWTGGNGSTTNIRNTNGSNSAAAQGACTPGVNCVAGNGNVGIGISSPSKTLTVSGSLKVMGNSDEALYCYATDSWVPVSSFNPSVCSGCQQGFALSGSSCTQVSCTSCNGSGCTTTIVSTGTAGVCGGSHAHSYTSTPSTNLCSGGTASLVSARTTGWTWSCAGTGGSSTNTSCYATNSSPINAVCGDANTHAYDSASQVNAAGLCTVGTANPVSGNGPWSWSCIGYNTGHSNSACNATVNTTTDGSCGPAMDASFSSAAAVNAAGLCNTGTPSPSSVGGSGPWYWDCIGIGNGAADESCSADYAPNAVAGVCGSANGHTYSAASYVNAAGLCSAGSASPSTVAGAGPWAWQCNGVGGGSTAQCSASIPTPVNGVCGASENTCSAGNLASPSNNVCTFNWSCNGINGGTNASCTKSYAVPAIQYAMGTPSDVATGGSRCNNKTFTLVSNIPNGTWTSNNSSIASIASNGLVNTFSPGGPVNITYTTTGACGRTVSISVVSCNSTVNGYCGSSNNTTGLATPQNLCATGYVASFTGGGLWYQPAPWTWSCVSTGGTTASCVKHIPAAGVCNSTAETRDVTNTYTEKIWQGINWTTANNLCTQGTAGYFVADEGGYNRFCGSTYCNRGCAQGYTPNPLLDGSCQPDRGVCGTANGNGSQNMPTTTGELCSGGTPSSLTGTGPWNWICIGGGANGGSPDWVACGTDPGQTSCQQHQFCYQGGQQGGYSPDPCEWYGGGDYCDGGQYDDPYDQDHDGHDDRDDDRDE